MVPSCAPRSVVDEYQDHLRLLPVTDVKAGLVRKGLFVVERVATYDLISQYTGNHVFGRKLERLHWAFDYHCMEPSVIVKVPTEDAVFDPRIVGNEGHFAKHSCSTNARLVELDVRGKKLIFITALREIEPDEEIYIDYQWCTGRSGSVCVLKCFCRSDSCREAI